MNGDDVTGYGLFVEHYQQFNTVWNGDRGRTIFYQNELAYDPPNQSSWMSGSTLGWAYKVADQVTTHEAWGLGAYSHNNVDPSIVTQRGFEVPRKPGVRMPQPGVRVARRQRHHPQRHQRRGRRGQRRQDDSELRGRLPLTGTEQLGAGPRPVQSSSAARSRSRNSSSGMHAAASGASLMVPLLVTSSGWRAANPASRPGSQP